MDKRYQVFVSSTYADLQDERRKVIQALMEMDCIPAGMELFPAADDEQWEFIKRVINDCDYYILIIGGRYGTLTEEGVSFTEREFDYAVSIGLKVLAFLHEDPNDISVRKSDIDPALRAKLAEFRTKVCTGRLVRFWNVATELPGLVALSLSKTVKVHPAIGWVRANAIATSEALTDLTNLGKENAELRSRLNELETALTKTSSNLAGLDETFEITLQFKHLPPYSHSRSLVERSETVSVTWAEIFATIAPELQEIPNDYAAKLELARALCARHVKVKCQSTSMQEDQFKTIRIQLSALGLVKVQRLKTVNGGMGFFWSLTPKGEQMMVELRSIKTSAK
jgi:hypothetical protein